MACFMLDQRDRLQKDSPHRRLNTSAPDIGEGEIAVHSQTSIKGRDNTVSLQDIVAHRHKHL